MNYGIMFSVCIIGSSEIPKDTAAAIRLRFPLLADYSTVAVVTLLFLVCTAYLVNVGYNPFLYFNF
jgi:hypothetical protein